LFASDLVEKVGLLGDIAGAEEQQAVPREPIATGATGAPRFPALPLRRKRCGNPRTPIRRARPGLILSLVTVSHGTKKKDPLKENSLQGVTFIYTMGLKLVVGVG
jgi:hypothetical protein